MGASHSFLNDSLPVVASRELFYEAWRKHENLLVRSPAGSRKTLGVPWLLWDWYQKEPPSLASPSIRILQSRRLAARNTAQFLRLQIKKQGKEPKLVGWKFRFEKDLTKDTKIIFQTYGSFLQEIIQKNSYPDILILDEFHERTSEGDLLVQHLLARKACGLKTPRLVFLSAQINAEKLQKHLKLGIVDLQGKLFPVKVIHQETPAHANMQNTSSEELAQKIIRVLRGLQHQHIKGDVLVFLPGKSELQHCRQRCAEEFKEQWDYAVLHGGQTAEEQSKLFHKNHQNRLLFSTNVAESAITIPGVRIVIDSGLERRSIWNKEQESNILQLQKIAIENATQRCGRAGREAEGLCIRLWSSNDEQSMTKEIEPALLQEDPRKILYYSLLLNHTLSISFNDLYG
jgi:ATP-dependent helicase HrpB